MKYVFMAAIFLSIVGCSSSPIVPLTPEHGIAINEVSFPITGELVEKNIGDVMVKKGRLELQDALNIVKQTKFNKKDGDSSILTCALAVEPQVIFLRGKYQTEKIQADCYGSINTRRTLADGGTNFNCPGAPLISADICKEPDGDIFLAFLSQRAELKQDFDNLQFVKKVPQTGESYIQEIVYNGRVGDKARFVYKEYSSESTKPDFFQEFETDLSNSNYVSFKSLKLEILEATESSVAYKLLESF